MAAEGAMIKTKRCGECEKTFCMTCEDTMWAYQVRSLKARKKAKTGFYYPVTYFCSWKCLRAYEKKNMPKKADLDDYLY